MDAEYCLRAGSPAINAGVDVGVSTDINGDPRIGLPERLIPATSTHTNQTPAYEKAEPRT